MGLPNTNPPGNDGGWVKGAAEVVKAFAMEKFWTSIKLADLPGYAKGGVAIAFMVFVASTVLALFGKIPSSFVIFAWIWMPMIYFGCLVWSFIERKYGGP